MTRARSGLGALAAAGVVGAGLASAACGSSVPETRYYQLAEPPAAEVRRGDVTIVLEPLDTDAAYDDERMVYRTTPYRLDYYHYHRWSSAPGEMISGYLEQALQRSGRFGAVVRELSSNARVVLGGRVVAIEELDASRTRWNGRLVLLLTLTDPRTSTVLWTRQYAEQQPMSAPTPEQLARALSVAMARIAARAIPEIADVAARQAAEPAPAAGVGAAGAAGAAGAGAGPAGAGAGPAGAGAAGVGAAGAGAAGSAKRP